MKISGVWWEVNGRDVAEIGRRIERIEHHLGIYENDERDIENPNHHGKYINVRAPSFLNYWIHGVRADLQEWRAYEDKQEECKWPECECHEQIMDKK